MIVKRECGVMVAYITVYDQVGVRIPHFRQKRTLSLIRRKSSMVEWLPYGGRGCGSSPAGSAKREVTKVKASAVRSGGLGSSILLFSTRNGLLLIHRT